ncbi:hypothetical protein U0070_024877 [Myodes glareolus]|uniref:Phosphodiesterase n=1 Tax=Myodes glareolus TaxID=447135 RepID=A0AAW0I6H1_MYOGA
MADPRFNAEVDQITGYRTQSILCMPIKNHREELLTLLQEESLFDQNPQLVWGLQSCGLSRGQDCLSLFTFGMRLFSAALFDRRMPTYEPAMLDLDQTFPRHLTFRPDHLETLSVYKELVKVRVVGVAQAINKKSGNGGTFTEKDEKDFAAYLAFCGIVLHNAQLYETSLLENKRNQVLLDLASLIFEEQQSLEVILKKIAATIISFMQVQKCTIFIVDEDCSDSFSSVFHMECEELGKSSDALTRVENASQGTGVPAVFIERRKQFINIFTKEHDASKINYMYAQYVKNTMEPLNIPDVAKDTRFPWTNEDTGHTNTHCTGSLLCTPIKNGKKNKVIGVCQLVNKMEENTGKIKPFNQNDEQFLEAFVIFCGLGIQNTQMYEAVERAMAKQMVTLEVLSYHASAAEEETRELQALARLKKERTCFPVSLRGGGDSTHKGEAWAGLCGPPLLQLWNILCGRKGRKRPAAAVVPSAQTLKITDFGFSDFELSDVETALCTIRMFTDLNLVQNFQMKHEVLCRWILSVKKNYRKNVAYHNWRHAFNTAQCMFAALKAGKIQNKLTDLETLALLIAALSHDLDHRGVNNSYIQRKKADITRGPTGGP